MQSQEADADSERSRERGASLALQISNAVGHVHKQLAGRGPTNVRTHIEEDAIICLLEGGFTRAELTVWQHAGEFAVMEMRQRLQQAMKPLLVEAVEAITDRRVRSLMSCNDPDIDLQAEIILLEPEVANGPAAAD